MPDLHKHSHKTISISPIDGRRRYIDVEAFPAGACMLIIDNGWSDRLHILAMNTPEALEVFKQVVATLEEGI